MVDIAALNPSSPLDGLGENRNGTALGKSLLYTLGDTCLCEINTLFIASLAIPKGKSEALNSQLQKHWGVSFPDTGTCVRGSDKKLASTATTLALFGLQMEQCLMVFDSDKIVPAQALPKLHELLGTDAYMTDQSDSFVVLEVKGSLMLPAMERLCMLDLSLFTEGVVARTVMEHLSVIIERPAPDCVRLYSPRSSARSFLEAVQVSLQNVHDDATAQFTY